MNSDTVLSVLGVALVALPCVFWHVRERRHALDSQIHREFMTWLDALERAGYEQAHDIGTTVIIARYRRLTANLAHSRS